MNQEPSSEPRQYPTVSEHPEQRHQEETGREDPTEVSEIGQPRSATEKPKKSEHAV